MITVVKEDNTELVVDATFTNLTADGEELRLATRNALLQAEEQGLHNIAFTALGAGELDPETEARVMVSETRCFLALSNNVENVIFSVVDDNAFSKVAKRDRIVCLGDSITFGYPGGPDTSWVALASEMVKLNLINEGINGDSTSGMLYRLKYGILPIAPAYVIILGGANDILFDEAGFEQIRDNIKAMATMALEAGVCPVLGVPSPVLPVGGFVPPYLAGMMAKIMADIGCWVKEFTEQEKLPVLDFYTPMLDPQTGKINPAYFLDGAHPNSKGYRELARAAVQVLLRLKKGFYYNS